MKAKYSRPPGREDARKPRDGRLRDLIANVALLGLPSASYCTIWLSSSPGQAKQWYLLRLMIPFLALFAITGGVRVWTRLSIRSRLLAAMQVCIAVGALLWTMHPEVDSTRAVAQATAATAGLLTILTVEARTSRFKYLCMGFLLAAGIVFGVAFTEYRTGRHLETLAGREWRFGVALGSTFPNPNNFAAHGLCLIGVSVCLLLSRYTKLRPLVVAALPTAMFLELMTGSRTGYVVAILLTLFLIYLWSAGRLAVVVPRVVILGAVGLLGLMALDASTGGVISNYLTQTNSDGGASDAVRASLAQAGMRSVLESGGIGWGPGVFEKRISSSFMTADGTTNMHNAVLEIAVTYGIIPALLIVLVILTAAVAGARQAYREPWIGAVCLVAATSAFLAGAVASSVLSDPAWWLTLSLVVIASDVLGKAPTQSEGGLREVP